MFNDGMYFVHTWSIFAGPVTFANVIIQNFMSTSTNIFWYPLLKQFSDIKKISHYAYKVFLHIQKVSLKTSPFIKSYQLLSIQLDGLCDVI